MINSLYLYSAFLIDDQLVSDKRLSQRALLVIFANVGKTVVSSIPPEDSYLRSYLAIQQLAIAEAYSWHPLIQQK